MKGTATAFTVLGLCVALYALGATTAKAQNADGERKRNALDIDYYNKLNHFCPRATHRIRRVIRQAVAEDPGVAAKLLRLHFHDCFVHENHTAERDARPNAFSLAGFDIIDKAKAAVEALCPRTVSCADIVALAARDVTVALAGSTGPSISWNVPLGRKDGKISQDSVANGNVPSPFANITTLMNNFAAKGLSPQQLVLLSGAHATGTANCSGINARLYPTIDPTLNTEFGKYLQSECPAGIKTKRIAIKDFLDDPSSNNGTFDNQYFINAEEGKGIFKSDNALITSNITKPFVDFYAGNSWEFINDFKGAMIAMGKIGVLTTGYVRKNCSVAFS